jgi:hypothetical protein
MNGGKKDIYFSFVKFFRDFMVLHAGSLYSIAAMMSCP